MVKPKEISGRIRVRFSAPKNLLAFEFDGFGLRAFVIEKKRGRISIKNAKESCLSDPDNALEEIMRNLRAENSLPKKAIVVTSEVLPTILELPVNPKRPRPYRQMHELVRWEIEPFLAEQIASNSIGSILVGKSYLNHEQAKEIAIAIEMEKDSLHQADQPVLRFAEQALKKGFITNDQLEECLSIQDRFQSIQDEPVCGWAYQKPSDQISGNSVKSKWLACGVGKSVLDKWMERLKKFKLEMSGLYPLTTSSTAILNGATLSARSAVFEIYEGLISCAQLVNGTIDSLQVFHMMAEERPSVQIFDNLLSDNVDQLLFAGRSEGLVELAKQTEQALGTKSKLFMPGNSENMPGNVKAESLVNVLGAASHSFELPDTQRIAYIPAEEPGPPLKARPVIWILSAGLIMAALLGIIEVSMQMKMKFLEKESVRITEQMGPLEEANKKILEKIALNESLQKVLAEKKAALKNSNERLDFLNKLVNERHEFSLYLLKAISAAIPKQVILHSLNEADETIELTGWTMEEEAAQRFAENLAVVMKGKVNNVGDLRVWTDQRQSGEPSYAFSLKMKAADF